MCRGTYGRHDDELLFIGVSHGMYGTRWSLRDCYWSPGSPCFSRHSEVDSGWSQSVAALLALGRYSMSMTLRVRGKRRAMRLLGLFVSVSAVLACFSGCSYPLQVPTISGAAGVTVDEAGNPVVVIAHCQKHVERVFLGGQPPGGGSRDWFIVAEWRLDPPITDYGLVMRPLNDQPYQGWIVVQPMQPLLRDFNYAIDVQATNGHIAASDVHFTPGDLETLRPDEVQRDPGKKRVPLSSFLGETCRTNA